jgi:hypothetical protein
MHNKYAFRSVPIRQTLPNGPCRRNKKSGLLISGSPKMTPKDWLTLYFDITYPETPMPATNSGRRGEDPSHSSGCAQPTSARHRLEKVGVRNVPK